MLAVVVVILKVIVTVMGYNSNYDHNFAVRKISWLDKTAKLKNADYFYD